MSLIFNKSTLRLKKSFLHADVICHQFFSYAQLPMLHLESCQRSLFLRAFIIRPCAGKHVSTLSLKISSGARPKTVSFPAFTTGSYGRLNISSQVLFPRGHKSAAVHFKAKHRICSSRKWRPSSSKMYVLHTYIRMYHIAAFRACTVLAAHHVFRAATLRNLLPSCCPHHPHIHQSLCFVRKFCFCKKSNAVSEFTRAPVS